MSSTPPSSPPPAAADDPMVVDSFLPQQQPPESQAPPTSPQDENSSPRPFLANGDDDRPEEGEDKNHDDEAEEEGDDESSLALRNLKAMQRSADRVEEEDSALHKGDDDDGQQQRGASPTVAAMDVDDGGDDVEKISSPPPPQQQHDARLALPAVLDRFFSSSGGAAAKQGGTNSNKKSTNRQVDKGAEILTRLMEQARYEVYVDPYRGMAVGSSDGEGAAAANGEDKNEDDDNDDACSPWKRECQVGFESVTDANIKEGSAMQRRPVSSQSSDDVAADGTNGLVRQVTHTRCPCLGRWTADLERTTAKAKKKRAELAFCGQVLGDCPLGVRMPPSGSATAASTKSKAAAVDAQEQGRSSDTAQVLRCACDYNPYCLLTMGGAMNNLLADATRRFSAEEGVLRHDYRDAAANQRLLDESAAYFSRDQLDVTSPLCLYEAETKHLLGSIRTSILVPERSIRKYLERTIHDILPLDRCIQNLIQRHQQLLFHNPLVAKEDGITEIEPGENMVRLALPPGIENLGATCYLNTQLQCLAQCLVFLSGVFQWRPDPAVLGGDGSNVAGGANSNSMQAVLLLFQRLLANLHAGGNRTYETTAFSDALGLDHHEQQDPNEFSRLFLERMDETFQQTSGLGAAGYDLKDLLSHLFQGNMCYETTCMECSTRSFKRETFRDLNLPIVEPKKPAKSRVFDFFSAPASQDTTVQVCLDTYCQPEELAGDNQYFCAVCNKKCDARRQVSFTKLPPLLNVQLCRYVFDRKSLSKKKLSDNVLLPMELLVSSRDPQQNLDAQGSASPASRAAAASRSMDYVVQETTQRYVLCAVMRHQGNSAYSGHYVAEAMDWVTGQWFEFNDQKVTSLESGPSCSVPSGDIQPTNDQTAQLTSTNVTEVTTNPTCFGSKPNIKKVTGSKDAYNLYYVEEKFLAQSIVDQLREERLDTSTEKPPDLAESESALVVGHEIASQVGVLESVTEQRKLLYADLARMCNRDGDACRKRSQLYIDLRASVIPDIDALRIASSDNPVWVHSERLRRFLELDFSIPLATPRSLLCSHKKPGLHPRIARRGKLLPSSMYEAISRLVDPDGAHSSVAVVDQEVVITPATNLECETCREEYCEELGEKMLRFAKMKELYDLLDPKSPSASFEFEDETLPTDGKDHYAYIISRSFASSYRKMFSSILKIISDADSMIELGARRMDKNWNTECIAEGLDALPLSVDTLDDCTVGVPNTQDTVDVQVNSCLMCPHGRFVDRSTKMFRRISYKDWALVQSLFPKAICFRERRQLSGESGTDEDEATCLECEAKDSEDDNRLRRIKELVVCSKDTILSDVSLKVALASSHKQYRIVHSGDVDAWKRLTTSVEGRGRGARLASADQAARFLAPKVSCARTLLSRDCESEPGLSDQRLRALASFLRPIVCESHGMPIETAIFRRQSSGDESRRELSDRIVIMEQNVYEEYVSNLVMAALILSPLGESEYPANRTLADDSKDAEDFIREFNLLDLLHPTFLARPASRELARTSSAIVGEFGGNEVLFDLSPGVCSDPACCSRFADWDNAEYGIDTATRAGVAEAIIVDSDIEEVADPTCMLRVFEIKADANAEDEYHNLAQCAGAAITDDTPSIGLGFFPRRSSRRKRKAPSYPVGAVMGDVAIQTSLAHNLAALRLTMMEACTDFELNHSLKFFVLRPDPFDAFVEESNILEYNSTRRILRSRVLDLPFQLNHQTLRNVCEDLLLEKLGPDFNPSEHLFIVRQSSIDLTSLDTGHDELFQVLIDASNNKDASVSRSGNGQRSGRSSKAPERGFRGTLLTGSARDESSAKDDDDAKPSASATTESNAAVGNNSRAAESTQGSPPLANRGSDGVHLKSPSVWNGRADASGIVVLDDNEDHDMDSSSPSRMLVETENDVPRGGFGPPGAPYRATPPPGKRHRDARVYAPISTANVIDVADSDSSDGDSLFNAPSLVRRSPQKTPPPRQQQPRQDRRSSTAAPPIPSPSGRRGVFGRGKDLDPETLIAKVAHALQRSQLGGDDQQLDAASYAVQNNPGCQDIDKLVVVAEFKLGELAGFYK